MTKTQKRLVNKIKELYEEHDHSEMLIVMAYRRLGDNIYAGLWGHHSDLESTIMGAEAKLPHKMVEKLKRGEL